MKGTCLWRAIILTRVHRTLLPTSKRIHGMVYLENDSHEPVKNGDWQDTLTKSDKAIAQWHGEKALLRFDGCDDAFSYFFWT